MDVPLWIILIEKGLLVLVVLAAGGLVLAHRSSTMNWWNAWIQGCATRQTRQQTAVPELADEPSENEPVAVKRGRRFQSTP